MSNDFAQVFKTIVSTYGIEILNDDARFLALFLDMAPKLNTEKKIIKRIKDDGMLVRFYKIATAEESAQQSMIFSLDNELREQLGFSDEWSSSVISAFCDACSITMPEIQTGNHQNSDIEQPQNPNPEVRPADQPVTPPNTPKPHLKKNKTIVAVGVVAIVAVAILIIILSKKPEIEPAHDKGRAPDASNKVVADVIASSQLNEPEYGINHPPHAVLENKDDTAWVEGVEGNGIGESITLQLNSNYTISGFKIKAGYFKSDDLYNKNSRPKKLLVTYSDMYGGGEIEVTLKDTKKVQTVTFDTPVEAYDISLIIESVYPGNKYEDTAITYVELF